MRKNYFILGVTAMFAFPFINLAAAESEKQYTPWTLKVGGGAGQLKEEGGNHGTGTSSNYRISAEYNPRYLGLEFGITKGHYSVPNNNSINQLLVVDLALVASRPGLYQPEDFAGPILIQKSTAAPFSINYLDIGPTLHFRPGKTFDPYTSIGIGLGESHAQSYRVYGRLGLRLNMDRAFLYLEGEGSSVNRSFGPHAKSELVYANYTGWFGAGLYLGDSSEQPEEKKSTSSSDNTFSEPLVFR